MLESFIEKLQGVRTRNELNDFILLLRDALEVEHVVYHSINLTGETYAVLTYDDDWVNRYISQNYDRIDPVVQACMQRFHPVQWQNLDWTGRTVRNFLGEALDSGVGRQGFSVPIRGPSGQFALFSVSHNASDDEWLSYTKEKTAQLILTSHYINQKALEIERGTDLVPMPSLSPRETDALTMLALGYNRAQAAQNLSISEHMLRVYIESARFKLAAMNTTHAVARATSSGLLVF